MRRSASSVSSRAAGDVQLLLGADDEVAIRQDGLQVRRDRVGAHVALLAGADGRRGPRGSGGNRRRTRPCRRSALAMRIALRSARRLCWRVEKCVPVTHDGVGRGDEALVDVVLDERHVGAVVAIEDQREALVVAARRGSPARSGAPGRSSMPRVATPSRVHLLADEAPHLLVADAGDEPGLQAEPRRADGDVGRAAADRLGEGRHVLEPPADLLAVEIDRGAADGDDVERGLMRPPLPEERSLSARTPSPEGTSRPAVESLGETFACVPDPRAGNAPHDLAQILVIAFAATQCVAETATTRRCSPREGAPSREVLACRTIPSHDASTASSDFWNRRRSRCRSPLHGRLRRAPVGPTGRAGMSWRSTPSPSPAPRGGRPGDAAAPSRPGRRLAPGAGPTPRARPREGTAAPEVVMLDSAVRAQPEWERGRGEGPAAGQKARQAPPRRAVPHPVALCAT